MWFVVHQENVLRRGTLISEAALCVAPLDVHGFLHSFFLFFIFMGISASRFLLCCVNFAAKT